MVTGKKKIAYLGPRGTFTEEALHLVCETILMEHLSPAQACFEPKVTIPDCLTACWKGEVDYAIVPMENSIEGSVNMTLDWLIHQTNLPIQAELTLPISQNAMIHPLHQALPFHQVEKIVSHPHAIAQCHAFIREHAPQAELEYTKSTGEAAEKVAKHPDQKWVAIGTTLAAQMNGLTIKAEEIQDEHNNYTRFVLVGMDSITSFIGEHISYTDKSTILVTLPEDFPGALHQVLSAFAWRRMNLTRVESRPTKKGLGHYYFFIDIQHTLDDVLLPGAISEIEALGCHVRFLGSYPCFLAKKISKLPT